MSAIFGGGEALNGGSGAVGGRELTELLWNALGEKWGLSTRSAVALAVVAALSSGAAGMSWLIRIFVVWRNSNTYRLILDHPSHRLQRQVKQNKQSISVQSMDQSFSQQLKLQCFKSN